MRLRTRLRIVRTCVGFIGTHCRLVVQRRRSGPSRLSIHCTLYANVQAWSIHLSVLPSMPHLIVRGDLSLYGCISKIPIEVIQHCVSARSRHVGQSTERHSEGCWRAVDLGGTFADGFEKPASMQNARSNHRSSIAKLIHLRRQAGKTVRAPESRGNQAPQQPMAARFLENARTPTISPIEVSFRPRRAIPMKSKSINLPLEEDDGRKEDIS